MVRCEHRDRLPRTAEFAEWKEPMMRATAVALPIVSIETKLAEVNARLQKGQGWIGYRYSKSTTGQRIQSKALYYAFYQGATQKFVNTGSNDPEEAYRQLLAARQHVADGNRKLPSEVAKLRYEDIMGLLIEEWREGKVAMLYTRNIKDKDGKVVGTQETFGGKDDLDKFFKRMTIMEIDALKIKDFIKRQRGQGYSNPTIRKQLGALRAAFAAAKNVELITDNNIPVFNMPEDSKPREGFMDQSEFDKFLAAFPENLQPTIQFLYYSGCRSGAAAQITWGMVDSGCTEIHAPGRIIKNDKDWVMPLVGPLDPVAKTLHKIRQKAAKENRILAADAPVFDFTNFRKIWNQTCHDLGLGTYITKTEEGKDTQRYTGLHAHDFRRSTARNLTLAGVPRQAAMKVTGHKTEAMFKRYSIQTNEDVKAALIAVGKRKKAKAVSITEVKKQAVR
jgi:integrase